MNKWYKMKKAIIYARVSSKKQKEEETINSQVNALHSYAKERGYAIPKDWIFLDDGVSGNSLHRAALDELRDVIRTERVECIFIYSPDRLSRKYSYQLILLEEFKKHCVKVCFLKDVSNTETPEGIMFNHFQGIFAEYERALILDRSRRGKLYKAKQGDSAVLPSIPYGYIKVRNDHKKTVEIAQEEANVVRMIYRLYIYEKKTLSQIQRILFENNMKSPKGYSNWHVTSIRNILNNSAYTGRAYYGKTYRAKEGSDKIRHYPSGKVMQAVFSKKKSPEENWIPVKVPQIIGETDYELAQEQIIRNAEFSARNTKEIALLQGLVLCGVCGNPFYKRTRKYKEKITGHYYCRSQTDKLLKKCSNGCVGQEELDELVYKEVISLLKNPSVLQDEITRRTQNSTNNEELKSREISNKKELGRISVERDRLLDAYQGELIDLKELRQRQEHLKDRKMLIEKDANAIQALKIESQINFEDMFKGILDKIQNASIELPLKQRQKLIRLLVEKVVVTEDKITITHCISANTVSDENCQLKCDAPER
jgi:site-specific DNA recombinase